MKILLLFPPQWMPTSPHFAIPTLLGQFRESEYKASIMDLNINFYNHILTKEYLEGAIKKAQESQKETLKTISGVYNPSKAFEDYTFDMQNKIAKYGMIKKYFQENEEAIKNVPGLIEQAVESFKLQEGFYNPEMVLMLTNIIDSALEIASIPYFPSKISINDYYNQFFKLDYETIKYYVFNKDTNMFLDYYEKILPEIVKEEYDCIGISINSSSQIVPGLTIANMLKNSTKAHINIGGNFFGRVIEAFEKHKEFFDIFAHSVLVEEGETPVMELAKYIDGKIPIEEASNLVYVKDGELKINKKAEPLKLDDMQNVSLEGLELDKYLTPDIIFPFQTSRGCYWRKCSFCDHDFGQFYNVKNLDKLIDQLKEMKEKYGITKFEFIDEAISPKYMEALSQRLLDENLKITYFCNGRLESEFSKELLQKAVSAGLRMVLWGVESGSKRIMKLINKGIDIDNRLNILRASREAGVFNFAFIFFGFPAETKEEAMQTIDMLCANTDIINIYGKSMFTMGKHTKLREDPTFYGVVGETKQESEFSPTYSYEAVGMTKAELKEMMDLCSTKCHKFYGNALALHLGYRELLFLYIDKHGADWVSQYRFEHKGGSDELF